MLGINIQVKSLKHLSMVSQVSKSCSYFSDSLELNKIIKSSVLVIFHSHYLIQNSKICGIKYSPKVRKLQFFNFKIQTFNDLMVVLWTTMGRFGVTFGSSTGSVLSPNKLLMTPAYIVFLTKSCKSPSPKIKIDNFKSQKR